MAPPESVVDALEVDLSHPFQDDRATGATIEHEFECVHNSVGDVGDGTGLTVVERAVDAQSHDCGRDKASKSTACSRGDSA